MSVRHRAGISPSGLQKEYRMAKKEERFIRVHSENFGSEIILVDKLTGVNYLFVQSGYAGGLTPLLNRDGTPVVTTVYDEE